MSLSRRPPCPGEWLHHIRVEGTGRAIITGFVPLVEVNEGRRAPLELKGAVRGGDFPPGEILTHDRPPPRRDNMEKKR